MDDTCGDGKLCISRGFNSPSENLGSNSNSQNQMSSFGSQELAIIRPECERENTLQTSGQQNNAPAIEMTDVPSPSHRELCLRNEIMDVVPVGAQSSSESTHTCTYRHLANSDSPNQMSSFGSRELPVICPGCARQITLQTSGKQNIVRDFEMQDVPSQSHRELSLRNEIMDVVPVGAQSSSRSTYIRTYKHLETKSRTENEIFEVSQGYASTNKDTHICKHSETEIHEYFLMPTHTKTKVHKNSHNHNERSSTYRHRYT